MNIYLLILLIIGIVLFANLASFGLVRGSRGMKFDWLNISKNGITKPFKKEDDQLSELRQRVEKLSQKDNPTKQQNNRTTK